MSRGHAHAEFGTLSNLVYWTLFESSVSFCLVIILFDIGAIDVICLETLEIDFCFETSESMSKSSETDVFGSDDDVIDSDDDVIGSDEPENAVLGLGTPEYAFNLEISLADIEGSAECINPETEIYLENRF